MSDFTDGTLVRLDATTGRQVGAALQVGSQPCGMAYGAGSIWLPDYGEPTLVRVDAATGALQAKVPIGRRRTTPCSPTVRPG